jgi:hypothetical protein
LKRFLLIFAAIFVVLAAVFIADHKLWFIDDRNHPDGVFLAEEFAAAQAAGRPQVNVIPVAGGGWLALCLVGPGENPQRTLVHFSRKNRIQTATIQRIRSWFYVGSVPEGEMALVFVSASYTIRSRRLLNYTGNQQFKSACALRNQAGLRWRVTM